VVSGGIRHDDGTYGLARLEYQINPAYSGMTLFADGRWSDHHDRILAGVKFHFGTGPKSLIRRHREDDPFYKVGNRVIFLPFRVPFLEEVGGGDEGMKID
jgi:hypothetical protein